MLGARLQTNVLPYRQGRGYANRRLRPGGFAWFLDAHTECMTLDDVQEARRLGSADVKWRRRSDDACAVIAVINYIES